MKTTVNEIRLYLPILFHIEAGRLGMSWSLIYLWFGFHMIETIGLVILARNIHIEGRGIIGKVWLFTISGFIFCFVGNYVHRSGGSSAGSRSLAWSCGFI